MIDSPKILVTLATYNERENLPTLVEEVLTVVPGADILVIDDNSPDGTGQWCDEFAADEPRLSCLHRPGKQGLGSATLAGFRRAVDDGYDVVVNLDADHSHPPRYIPALLAGLAEGADVMIGSRYVTGGQIEGWPWWRRVMSRAINAYARLLLRLPVRDASGSFRAYRVAALARLDFAQFRASGYAYLEEILLRLLRSGAVLAETPITFVERQHGRSKINIREAAAALWLILRLGLGGK